MKITLKLYATLSDYLPDGALHTTYVAERNLETDETGDPVRHPLLDHFFARFENHRLDRRHHQPPSASR